MHAAGYLTAGVAELIQLPLGVQFAWTAVLLAAFTAVLTVTLRLAHRGSDLGLVIAALTASALAVAVTAVGVVPSLGAILFFVICTIAGMRLPVAAVFAWVIGAAGALLGCLLARGERDWLPTVLSFGVGYFAVGAIGVTFRRSLQARAESQQLLAELTSAQGRLREMAVVEERQRLAREMHDAVGHRLTAASVLLEGPARLIGSEPERAARMVETSRAQVRQGLDELRAAVSALHTDASGTQSVREILTALVEVFGRGTDARVILNVDPGLPEPDPDRQLVIIRTSQEALTNVQKHAAATGAELVLKAVEGAYVLTCRDNGRGLGTGVESTQITGNRFGLRNLRERVQPFGGRVDLEAIPDGGAPLRSTNKRLLSIDGSL